MKLKKFNKFLIVLAVISGGLTGTVLSNSNIHSSLVNESKATNDISWSIDGNGNIKPSDKSKVSGEITIPDTVDEKVVTGIAESAFDGCSALTSVNFDNNSQLTTIGAFAFNGCSALTSVNIPNSVTNIDIYAFSYCISMTTINFDVNSRLTSIDNTAFTACKSIISIDIPKSVTSIGNNAFNGCSALTSVNFAEGSKLNSIGKYAFSECASLTSVNIPSSVTSIKRAAFQNCSSLTDVTFNWDNGQLGTDKLTLETDLFNNTSRQTINFHIPLGTKDQYISKFAQDILGTNITANWIDYIQWNITDAGLISPADKGQIRGEITIPDTVDGKVVTGIANDAFSSCYKLIGITIPNSVTSIGNAAFWNCSSLKTINIPGSVTSIADYAFESCTSLTSVNFDNDSQLTSIGYMAFNGCGSLKNITIPNSVTSFGALAFSKCALTSINIPSSVTSIESQAFSNCSSLTDVTFNWDNGQLVTDKLTLGTDLFNNTSRQTINFHIPWGTKDQYKATFTPGILGTNITAKWIEDNPPVPSSNSNLALILGLTFGFIILIGIGSYLGYRYYKHRKNSK